LHGLLSQDLRLVQHENVHLRETTTKPCSRAPNSTREPLANSTASVPAPVNTRRTNGFTSGSSAIDPIDLNVSLCVRDRCADHSTSVSGFAKHNANAKAPNVYVFPA